MRSSIFDAGQPLTSFVRVSASQAFGLSSSGEHRLVAAWRLIESSTLVLDQRE
jgi:hypothetical protein